MTQFTTAIGSVLPHIAVAFGGVLGLVAIVALGRFVVARVRGSIK